MLTEASNKTKNIVDGWKNLLFRDEQIEALAKTRLKTCGECPHQKGFICGLCGCPLKAKSRAVNDKCPDGRWAA
jgi:hypothetical protein